MDFPTETSVEGEIILRRRESESMNIKENDGSRYYKVKHFIRKHLTEKKNIRQP